MATGTIINSYACGCVKTQNFTYDGRSQKSYNYYRDMTIRAWGISLNDECYECYYRRAERINFEYIGLPLPHFSHAIAKIISRIKRKIGGSLTKSPKSDSMYITRGDYAIRISDHSWYSTNGRRASLLKECHFTHNNKIYFIAKLVPDWLAYELGEK